MKSTAPLVIYGMGSPNVRKVAIMLEEMELPYELRHVAVFKGEQFTAEFKALNPLSKVPVLVDPLLASPLAESAAIVMWLAERTGSPLMPTEPSQRYAVMQWVMIQMASIGPMLGQLNHFQMLADREPYSFGRYHAQAEKLYRLLDDRLSESEFTAGDAYSIADIVIYPWATYLEQHRFDPASHPSLVRWRDRIAERPAVKRAADRMAEAFTAVSTESRRSANKADLDRFFGRDDHMPDADYSAVTK